MFRKLNTKTLALIFGALLLIVVLFLVFQKSGDERNFKENLADIDTAKITAVTISPKGNSTPFTIRKTGKSWNLEYKGKTYHTDNNTIRNILSGLVQLKPERLASTEKEKWADYEVSESLGTRIKVEQENKTVADIIIGKVSYQQNFQKVTTYARLINENEIYALNGFLSMNFNPNINSLRYKSLGKGTPDEITNISFNYPADSSFSLIKAGNKWNINNEPADSMKVNNFLQMITTVDGTEFMDDNTPVTTARFSVIAASGGRTLFEIKASPADSINKFIITSSANAGAKFSETKDGVISRVFVSENYFKNRK